MKPSEEIKRLIHESKITTGPEADERILRDALNELEKRRRERTEPLDAALWRAFMKNKVTKIGTVALLLIAALVAFQFLGNPFGPKLTFANVIKPILNANAAAYDIVVGPDDGSTRVMHDLVMGSRIRRRIAGSKEVSITDNENLRMLVLDEANMEALYVDLKGTQSIQNYLKRMPPIQNYLEYLKNTILRLEDMPDFTVEELGRKQIDGKEVVGFFASHPKIDITAWADVDTGLPVRIELNEGQAQLHLTYKNMEFDLPIEEETFSMEVPAGYTVQEPMNVDLQAGTEANFIKGLRLIAEKLNYGFFPNDVSLDYFYKWRTGPPPSQLKAMSKEEVAALNQEIIEYILFIRLFPGEGKWTYRGQGVRLGEAEMPIFWYRSQGSETYRVIYGDLHVENVYPEDLPD